MQEHKSYAQDNEDLLIFDLLKKNNLLTVADKPFYFDIGVNNPIIMSNTYLFYTLGFHGVLVEPLKSYSDYIQKTRPRDFFVEGAIGTFNGPGCMKKKGRHGGGSYLTDVRWVGAKRCYSCDVYTIDNLFTKYGVPVFMSLDVEGLELAILDTLPAKVPVICLEYTSQKATNLLRWIKNHGYRIENITESNIILIDIDHNSSSMSCAN